MKYLFSIIITFIFISRSSAQEIYLNTDPADAYVMKNDSLIGHTPLFIPLSLNKIFLQKPGYAEESINLGDYDGIPVKLKFTGRKTYQSFYESSAFKIFIGSIVALGAVTAYFKIKADNRFDDYQNNGNHDLLNETRRYDLISGISFAALQVNFGFLIYYLLIY
ncbi:MAG: hypothetical protein P4L27_08895 [Ignavibacteriaceae bacterium]|nr:hypothetical protein [Ignavibacteriaceae bacterium]